MKLIQLNGDYREQLVDLSESTCIFTLRSFNGNRPDVSLPMGLLPDT